MRLGEGFDLRHDEAARLESYYRDREDVASCSTIDDNPAVVGVELKGGYEFFVEVQEA